MGWLCVGIPLRKGSNLLVLPITTLDHSCGHFLLLLQPPTLRKENEAKSQHLTAYLVDSGPTPSEVSSLKNVFFTFIYLCVCMGMPVCGHQRTT